MPARFINKDEQETLQGIGPPTGTPPGGITKYIDLSTGDVYVNTNGVWTGPGLGPNATIVQLAPGAAQTIAPTADVTPLTLQKTSPSANLFKLSGTIRTGSQPYMCIWTSSVAQIMNTAITINGDQNSSAPYEPGFVRGGIAMMSVKSDVAGPCYLSDSGPNGSDCFQHFNLSTDTVPVLDINRTGDIAWGPGTGAADATLKRSQTNRLYADSAFTITGGVGNSGGLIMYDDTTYHFLNGGANTRSASFDSWANVNLPSGGFGAFGLTLNEGKSVFLGTTSGSQIGTAASQKLALWGKTPDVQPTNAIAAAAFVANSSLIANDTATFGGYTLGQIAAALIRIGALT